VLLHAPTPTKGSTNTGENIQSIRKNHTALNNYEGMGQKAGNSPELNLAAFCIVNKEGLENWTYEFGMKPDSPCRTQMEQH